MVNLLNTIKIKYKQDYEFIKKEKDFYIDLCLDFCLNICFIKKRDMFLRICMKMKQDNG